MIMTGRQVKMFDCVTEIIMKTLRSALLVGAVFLVFVWGDIHPVGAQGVICCNKLINVNGNWVGASRTCDLNPLPPDKRTSICQKLKGCDAAAKYCSAKESSSQSSESPAPAPGETKAPPESRSSGRR